MNLDPFQLQRFAKKVYSQFGEDGILLELVRRLEPQQTFLEIGAGNNGENCTHILLDEGWTGYWVEGNRDHFFQLWSSIRTDRITVLNEMVRPDNVRGRLHHVRERLGRDIGVFSLDIDGNDYWVWRELCSLFFRPAICVIECNAQKPFDERYIMPEDPNYVWDHKSNDHGASIRAMVELGTSMGYRFVGMASATPSLDSPNAFFVRDDLALQLERG